MRKLAFAWILLLYSLNSFSQTQKETVLVASVKTFEKRITDQTCLILTQSLRIAVEPYLSNIPNDKTTEILQLLRDYEKDDIHKVWRFKKKNVELRNFKVDYLLLPLLAYKNKAVLKQRHDLLYIRVVALNQKSLTSNIIKVKLDNVVNLTNTQVETIFRNHIKNYFNQYDKMNTTQLVVHRPNLAIDTDCKKISYDLRVLLTNRLSFVDNQSIFTGYNLKDTRTFSKILELYLIDLFFDAELDIKILKRQKRKIQLFLQVYYRNKVGYVQKEYYYLKFTIANNKDDMEDILRKKIMAKHKELLIEKNLVEWLRNKTLY
ncbi:MAG TPA: hypothetical protein DCS93_15265 [Microscillaceae bacterium]|nr:hypothetical protein [Microscillaceae bacterium]